MANISQKENREHLAEARSKEILTVSKRIFAQHGYRRTTIDQIANELNVGKGTVYRYFKSKKELYLRTLEDNLSAFRDMMEDTVSKIERPELRFKQAIQTFCNYFENDKDLVELMMQVRSEFKEENKEIFLRLYGGYIKNIQDTLRQGQEKGIFRKMDIRKTAEVYSALMHGILQTFYLGDYGTRVHQPSPGLLTKNIDVIIEFVLHGIMEKK